ncbi:LacI family DNA-binding transcriptional regulator [Sphingomonas sp. HT-1]|uniref:LacI family DNA-binding transcriptional regulator n=1 Tax=unclassified Sphingomonas TaxID=196159 RepID=UPI0002F4488C|nr:MULTISPECIES: LacI family DNA-binding transcriptional regulator [unclassified Sphingomonas]KTF67416.1 LacI family transcriptional regulator [Sphingomonas sp. WG]
MTTRPTIKEVSKIAGVSFKTVSRVLNNEKHVSDETRRRVEEVVAQLNFRPSHAARILAGRRSFQVALLYDNPSPYYVFHIQAGAMERCGELGYRLLMQPVDSTARHLAKDVLALVDEAHLDGLILSPPLTEMPDLIDALDKRKLPYVRIAPGLRKGHGLSTTMDDVAAAREITRHLIDLGHCAIAFVSGPESHVSSKDRMAGYRQELEAHGILFDPALVIAGDYSFASGGAAARALLARNPRPTAIFAGNDDMAAGALAAAHEADLGVPDALSIAGFDDSDLARAVWPPLTTIRQPVRQLAYAAVDLMLSGQALAPQLTLDHELKIRATTGPAPKA